MNRKLLAEEIIETCLEMARLGLNQGTSGNVSARYREGMLITPSGIHYEKMWPDQVVYLDGQGRYQSAVKPSSEWRFHLASYQARPEANAVIHNHAVNATAVSILNRSIPAIHYMIAVAGGNDIPCAPYATFGSQALSDNVMAALHHRKAALMQHHGLIVAEASLEKALWLAQEVETLARLYLKLLPLGEVPLLPDNEIERVVTLFENYGPQSSTATR